MKKLISLTLVLLLLLTACVFTDTIPQDQLPSKDPTNPTQPPHVPVDEDLIYFANNLEYNRLYSIRRDGTDPQLVLDEWCYGVRQQGDTLYFQDRTDLCSYHIPTGERSVIVPDIVDFSIEGDHLVYRLLLDGIMGSTDLRYRDLSTGEDISIYSDSWSRMWMGFGRLYYEIYPYDGSGEELWVFDTETRESTLICSDFYYYSTVVPVTNGAYFLASGEEEDQWYFTGLDDSTPVRQEDFLPERTTLIFRNENGCLYTSGEFWDSVSSALHFVDLSGKETVLATWDYSSTNTYFSPLSDGYWLMEQNTSVGWGEQNEYGYYENYAYPVDYFLISPTGDLTPLDVTGECGALFSDGDFPLLDSSTARIPVTNALYDLFVKRYGYDGPEPLCSTTHGAWLNIADRQVDLAFLAAPTPEEQAYLEEQGVSVEMKLYGGDGLVFIGNAANPVTNLTHEQILAIYRGEITNWKELGGPDHEIIVYYRDEQSGSQRLFKNLVFKGLEVPDFDAMAQENPNFWLWDDMGSIVNMILDEPYAIGYSIMTYLDEVYAEDDLIVFSVDGVTPSPDTVKDGSYRYHTQGYIVIRSDEPENSPARRLFNWFGCPISDDLLINAGVTPLHDDP
ncbi:MAG: substrate-binding domain-containing protein [Oscillospiraceae bacterium]|nr:substrate-binding domain-containing protein [Oscillospiraceae bacterium]